MLAKQETRKEVEQTTETPQMNLFDNGEEVTFAK
jgi:hypothetical protein